MPNELPSPDELAERVAARRRDQQQRDENEQQTRKAAQDAADRNLNLYHEFADKARAADLPTEEVEIVSAGRILRRKRRSRIAGWDTGLFALGDGARWLLAPGGPPFWWKVTQHRDRGKVWHAAEQVPLEKGRPLWGGPPEALQLQLTLVLVELTDKKQPR
jgi:hypothetical protein